MSRRQRLITGRCLDQLDLPCAPWTREVVAALIQRETGMRLSASAIGAYLRSWRFTAQRPIKQASERRKPAVCAWLARDDPAIAVRAKMEDGEIQ
jgi:transposase